VGGTGGKCFYECSLRWNTDNSDKYDSLGNKDDKDTVIFTEFKMIKHASCMKEVSVQAALRMADILQQK
jgi:hypothetical protein